MKQLSSMDFDELLALKQKVEAALASRVKKERERLTTSLQQLDKLNLPGTRRRSACKRTQQAQNTGSKVSQSRKQQRDLGRKRA
jgi:hypothetical protein